MMSFAGSVFGYEEQSNPTKLSSTPSPDETSSDESDDGICLYSRFPTLSKGTCDRFQRAFGVDNGNQDEVIKKLDEYLEFRDLYDLDKVAAESHVEDDQAEWEWASRVAISAAKTFTNGLVPGLEKSSPKDRICKVETLPRLVYVHKNPDGTHLVTKDGNPVIHYLSARLDLDVASSEIYALCICLYFERKTKWIDFNKGIVLMCDVRRGRGWPNHKVFSVANFLQTLTNTLHKIYPGQTQKMIIYSVPYACAYVFSMFKSWLPTAVAETVVLLDGSDDVDSPAPYEELSVYITREQVEILEENRKAQFVG